MSEDAVPGVAERRSAERLRELAWLFLRLGATAFGGPAAHIGMMEDEIVARRGWMTHERFMDLVGATNLIPGPNSTEMAIHIGYVRAGVAGLLVAGACFIGPAVAIVLALAWAYVRYGSVPQVAWVLDGVKPVVIAIVAQAMWRLGRSALKSWVLWSVAVASVVFVLMGVNELVVLLMAAVVTPLARSMRRPGAGSAASMLLTPVGAGAGMGLVGPVAAASASGGLPFSIGGLFLFFLKVGSVLFGSGYVLLAFLRGDLVQRWGWLTEQQLMDAVAVGQVTPGPVFTTATFIGYVLGGWAGAAVATAGIFAPAFVFVGLSGPIVPRIRRSKVAGGVLDGVNAGSLALMGVVTVQLAQGSITSVWAALLAAASLVALMRYRVNSTWLIVGGAAVGVLVRLAGWR